LRVLTPFTKGLGDHRDERLLAPAPGLEEAREVAAASQARDRQLEAADARVPLALAVAVALREALRRALVALAAGELGDLSFHDLDQHQSHCLAQHVGVFARQHLACSLARVHAA
jgi:hypothetical protein